MHIAVYDVIGFLGVAVLMGAYFANQQRWLPSDDWRYPSANLAGAVLILVSLFYEWNFPSVVIEICWIAISLWGLGKWARDRQARRDPLHPS